MTAIPNTTNDVRAAFLDYFHRQGHTVVPSSPVVPRNDPTLMFTNAGMVQFKDTFIGQEQRPYVRATSSQKCLRAGGKHNDLENVGYTARHHTFFEMLGNFSFGDYFKDGAIQYAWELVTKDLALPQDKLLVTVYHEDEEAATLWKKIASLSDDRIIRIATSDNFWSMGDTGPCGPCSEIFYDHGDHIPGGPPGSPDEDGDRFIEIWNLVFMQFEQLADGSRINLPKPSIDTGMGLERITAILQGKHDNYDIDLMRGLIEAIAHHTSIDPDGAQRASHRVIADHLRSSAFLIADGVLPSNEGRGYVLRRIMRRGMRHAHLLGAQDPLLHKIAPELVQRMGEAFPELVRAKSLITETLRLEEQRFRKTLDRGLHLLDDALDKLGDGGTLAGDVAFKLYDTYGFPLDLTQDVLRGRGLTVDVDGFNTAMAKQKADARAAWAGSGEAATEKVWFDVLDVAGTTEFLGYDATEAQAEVRALVQDGALVQQVKGAGTFHLVVNQTPFYAESGGQVGDTGTIVCDTGTLTVTDTRKRAKGVFVHSVTTDDTDFNMVVGDKVTLRINTDRRDAIRRNHSATHLLHEELRRQLGDHVAQKGSMVAADRLRLDISQPTPVANDTLTAIEQQVNARIVANSEVSTRLMPVDEAMASGARALFGEKYGDEVRVVTMGGAADELYSVELCGGTHVQRTGDIGLFRIVSEGAVSAGVRRVEAITGAAAIAQAQEQQTLLQQAAEALKTTPGELPARLATLVDERRRMEQEISDLRRKLATGGAAGNDNGPEDVNGTPFIARVVEDLPARDLKPLVDDLKAKAKSAVVTVVAVNDGKASLVVGVTPDLTARFSAVDLVRTGSAALGGKGGGGRPDMAQAGGPDGTKAQEAVKAIRDAL